jgi:uncharacterized protein
MDHCIIKPSPGKGNGLFSTVNIPANTIIFQFVGKPILRAGIPDFSGVAAACYLQIGKELYLDVGGHYSFFINHACQPNCGVRIMVNKAFVVSLRAIKAGDELTFDYSTTSTEDESTWSMRCNCSMFRCRKLITGFWSLPEVQKKRYIDLKVVPGYVLG